MNEKPVGIGIIGCGNISDIYFENLLGRESSNMSRVADKAGLERTHLYRKLKQLGIDLSRGAYRKQGS